MTKSIKKLIFIGIFITLAIIFISFWQAAAFRQQSINPTAAKKDQASNETKVYQIDITNSLKIGSSKPKVTIIEFGDYSCTYTKQAYPTIRRLMTEYAQKDVLFVFKPYPLNDNSINLALASYCANEQNKFWPLHDKLFQANNLNQASVNDIYSQLNLNNNFTKCLTSKAYLNKIKKDYSDANNATVTGTPTFFINGQKISGVIDYQKTKTLIDKLLSY